MRGMPCGAHFLISCHSFAFRFFTLSHLHLFILVIFLHTHTDVFVIDLSPAFYHYRFEWSQRPAGTRSRSQLSGFYRPR